MPRLIILAVIASVVIQAAIAIESTEKSTVQTRDKPVNEPVEKPADERDDEPLPKYSETPVEYPMIKRLILTTPNDPTKYVTPSTNGTYLPMEKWMKSCWGTENNFWPKVFHFAQNLIKKKEPACSYKKIVEQINNDCDKLHSWYSFFATADSFKTTASQRAKELKKCRIENPNDGQLSAAVKQTCQILHENVMISKEYMDINHGDPFALFMKGVHSAPYSAAPQSDTPSGFDAWPVFPPAYSDIKALQPAPPNTPSSHTSPSSANISPKPVPSKPNDWESMSAEKDAHSIKPPSATYTPWPNTFQSSQYATPVFIYSIPRSSVHMSAMKKSKRKPSQRSHFSDSDSEDDSKSGSITYTTKKYGGLLTTKTTKKSGGYQWTL